jgi:large subunit ribosomal protein L3
MPTVRLPRSGSMQFWPRKRARRAYARIRNSNEGKTIGMLGFAGYKVGMTHLLAIESRKHAPTKGEEIAVPVTVIECPPLKIASARFYKKTVNGLMLAKEVFFRKKDSYDPTKINIQDYHDIRVSVVTQPGLTGIGKKKPELFEMRLGGTLANKFSFINDNKDKEIHIESVIKEGELVDVKSITKGKGFQGPVKRFGISLRQSKSEKSRRNPGSLGPWKAQGQIMYRVAHAGKMGYHQRTEHNKQVLKIIKDPITMKGGFLGYGVLKNSAILVKGSVAGARKRMIIIQKPIRISKKTVDLPTINEISLSSKQGK